MARFDILFDFKNPGIDQTRLCCGRE